MSTAAEPRAARHPLFKIHCISMDSAPERWNACAASLADVPGVELVRFPAAVHEHGWVGCALSHATCIASRLGAEPYIIVMEDDNAFLSIETLHSDLCELTQWLVAHPDDWNYFNGSPTYWAALPKPEVLSYAAPRLISCKRACCSNFMIYGASILPLVRDYFAVLQHLLQRPITPEDKLAYPCDVWLAARARCATRLPFLCTQRDGWSYIERKHVSYNAQVLGSERYLEEYFAACVAARARSALPAPLPPHKISLCMIVRNEEHVFERALRSALRFVDTWVIVDTGSTDRTMVIIRAVTAELRKPGVLYESGWVNFGTNRTEALEKTRGHAAFAWMLDADDSIESCVEPPLPLTLSPDIPGYHVAVDCGGTTSHRVQIFNLSAPWEFVGAVHEYPTCPDAARCGTLDGYRHIARTEGARSKDLLLYAKDAVALQSEYLAQPQKSPRTIFYLAQSYRDAGDVANAIRYYNEYVTLPAGYSAEEKYVSNLNLASMSVTLRDKLRHTWAALEGIPARVDAVYQLLRGARARNQFSQELYALGVAFAPQDAAAGGTRLGAARSGAHLMYITFQVWQYYDELSAIAYWTGHYAACIQHASQALCVCEEVGSKARIANNITCAATKL
jgi:glycosyltransferase involved in cell wall biosynthesis